MNKKESTKWIFLIENWKGTERLYFIKKDIFEEVLSERYRIDSDEIAAQGCCLYLEDCKWQQTYLCGSKSLEWRCT